MSDGPDDPRDELHDAELSRRYRALPNELPHPDTDAAIQAAARQALAGVKRKPRSAAFYGGLAMAASVTLVVAVLLPSWRNGQWQVRVAAREPAEIVAAPVPVQEAVVPALPTGPTRPREAPIAAAPTAAVPALERAMQARVATAGQPTPAEVGSAASEQALSKAATPMLQESRLAEADARPEAVAADAQAGAGREERADHAREQTVFRQQARTLMAPPSAPAAKPVLMTNDALLLAGRYADALAALQTGAAATDASLDSRRDLLRQLLPNEAKALQCQAGTGPDSARALCRLLQQYQAVQQGRADRSVLAASQAALQQALQAEGHHPVPLMHAIADLLEEP